MIGWVRNITKNAPPTKSCKRCAFAPALEQLGERCLLNGGYLQTNLISDVPNLARFTDPNVVNPWGISVSPSGPFWLSDNATGISTINTGDGQGSPFVVGVPGLAGGLASPTGTVFYDGNGFGVAEGGLSGPSMFLFATEQGTIAGWNPDVDPNNAITAVDRSQTPGVGAVYTGLAIATSPQGTFLYAANFRSGAIDVFDESFAAIHWQGAFKDPAIPGGCVPFNVQAIGNSLVVTYIEQGEGRYAEGTGLGNGYVDVFDTNGNLRQRLVSRGPLDAPWGVALAPSNFGEFKGDLLVGNFGDGRINAFDPQNGKFMGALTDAAGQPIAIPELWGLNFGNDGDGGPSGTLYFAAGVGKEYHGLFGSLEPAAAGKGSDANLDAQLQVLGTIEDIEDDDAYPLPPGNNPSLQQPALTVTFAPLEGSTLAVVPTLSAAAGTRTVSPIYAQAPPLSPAGQGQGSILVSLGITEVTGPSTETVVAGLGAAGRQAPFGGSTLLGLLPRPLPTEGDATLPSEIRDTSILVDAAGTETGTRSTALSKAPLTNEGHAEYRYAVQGEDRERPVAVASIGPSMAWNSGENGWLIQVCQYLLVVLIAGCGMRFIKVRRRPLGEATFTTIRSIWTRFTGPTSSTILAHSAPLASSDLLRTEVIAVVPQTWEKTGLRQLS